MRGGDAGREDARGIQAEGEDDRREHEPVGAPHLPPRGGARVGRRREAGDLQGRGGVGEVLRHRRRAAREGGRDPERRPHERDLRDGEAHERTAAQAGVEVGDRRAPVPPPGRTEHDEEHDLGDDEQSVRRAEVGPRSQPGGGRDDPRRADRDIGPERQRRVAPGDDGEVARERAVERDENDEPTDPHRGADEVQPHRVDRRLVVVGRAGVAGQTEHEDAGRGQRCQPRRGPPAPGERGPARDDDGARGADETDPGGVDLPGEVGELGRESRAGQGQARRVGEGQHDPGERRDRPDSAGDQGQPQRRRRGRRRGRARGRGRGPWPRGRSRHGPGRRGRRERTAGRIPRPG